METQCLYYAEMKIIVNSVELKERLGKSEVERERKTREKEQKENKKKQTGV